MNVEYDNKADAAYLYLMPVTEGTVKKTYLCDPREVGGQINLDFDAAGHLVGIEVLDASRLLPKVLLRTSS